MAPSRETTAGIVLVGGHSRRMGRPKAWLEWGGRTLLQHAIAEIARGCGMVAVLSRTEDQELPELPPSIERWHDVQPDAGPLAAVADGLGRFAGRAEAVAVCACDQPFFDATAVRWLTGQLDGAHAVVPRHGGFLNPVAAVYAPAAASDMAELARTSGARAQRIGELPMLRVVEAAAAPNRRFVLGCNTHAEYLRLRELARLPFPETP